MQANVAKHYRKLAALAACLALAIVVFGAFVRLSNAGLSCPDWPTCYGQMTWPDAEHEIASANAAFPERPVEQHKAWREQGHRFLAGLLGLIVLTLALWSNWQRSGRRALIIAAAMVTVAATVLYTQQQFAWSVALCGSALLALIGASLLWRDAPRGRLGALTLAVIIFQAVLGMWTVTWKLQPIVVTAHLLGGMATFALLLWAALADRPSAIAPPLGADKLRRLALIGLVLLAAQIALGGWTSANYAALVCPDFPTCQKLWWPQTDFAEGFALWRAMGANHEFGLLELPARTAIQLTHRIGALLVFGHLLVLGLHCLRRASYARMGAVILTLLMAQITLGIANVKLGLPLAVATAHNAGAALLLASLLLLLARTRKSAL